MDTFTIDPAGPFALEEAALFGFGQRHDTAFDGTMRLAFCVDGHRGQAAVAVTQDQGGAVHGTITDRSGDAPPDAVAAQVARVLSIDHDATGYVDVGRRDPVVARLLEVRPGLRPPLFYSPYEAAAWAVLSTRRSLPTAAAWRTRISQAASRPLVVAGATMWPLPLPEHLAGLGDVPGIEPARLERVRGVARAALEGRLDAAELAAMDVDAARARLRTIPGIGPFYADLLLVRAVGLTDLLPGSEPRLLALMGELYGLQGPAGPDDLVRITAAWTPWRTWVAVLVRAAGPRLLGRVHGAGPERPAGGGAGRRPVRGRGTGRPAPGGTSRRPASLPTPWHA